MTNGPDVLAYDAAGNLSFDGANTYSYDLFNRLKGADVNGSAGSEEITIEYDPVGRMNRLSDHQTQTLVETKFLYDGGRVIAEYDGVGDVTRRYVYGVGLDEVLVWYEGDGIADRNHLMSDNLGTIIAVVDGEAD